MMGRLNHDQAQLFYSFCLEEVVPDDHLVRELPRFSTCRGCVPSLRLTIPTLADLRLIRNS
jgi:hypothetical protein